MYYKVSFALIFDISTDQKLFLSLVLWDSIFSATAVPQVVKLLVNLPCRPNDLTCSGVDQISFSDSRLRLSTHMLTFIQDFLNVSVLIQVLVQEVLFESLTWI